jgi:hypothetical protein
VKRDPCGAYTAIGSNKGLVIHADIALDVIEHRELSAVFRLRAGQRIRFVLQFQFPELIERSVGYALLCDAAAIDRQLECTRQWWRDWVNRIRAPHDLDAQTVRSAVMLKSLTYVRTGAIAAALTTSLPEWIGGERNWDYRFSWVRDSVFIVYALKNWDMPMKQSTSIDLFNAIAPAARANCKSCMESMANGG